MELKCVTEMKILLEKLNGSKRKNEWMTKIAGQAEIDISTIIVVYSNTMLWVKYRTTDQKVNKDEMFP